MLRILTVTAMAIAFTTSVACKGGGDADADTATAESGAADTTSTASNASGSSGAAGSGAQTTGFDAPVTAKDIDVYERALAAEVAEVRKALDKRRSARTQADTAAAMAAALDMTTTPAAAEKAGIPVERYRYLESVFGRAISARKMNPLAKMLEDTSSIAQLPPEMQEQARKNLAELRAQSSDSVVLGAIPPELRNEFKRRAATRLDTLWLELFALRARAAGIAR